MPGSIIPILITTKRPKPSGLWPWPHGRKGSGHSCPITPFPVSIPRFWGVFLIWIRSLHWVTDFRTGRASTGRILVHGRGSMEGILDFWKPQLCPTPGKQECTPGDGPKLQLIPVPWQNRENPSPAGLCTGLILSPPNSWGAEADLYIRQSPVGVWHPELCP